LGGQARSRSPRRRGDEVLRPERRSGPRGGVEVGSRSEAARTRWSTYGGATPPRRTRTRRQASNQSVEP
jgi:hypothetical protein